MNPNSRSPAKSSQFKIIAGKSPSGERIIRAGGMPPPDEMPADKYITLCEGAKIATLWGKPTAVLTFRVADGKYFGVSLLGYFDIDMTGETTNAGCEYNTMCEIALNRELEPGDDLNPTRIFPGKVFEVAARYRKASPGKRGESQDPTVKKDKLSIFIP
jgi:hypothetical protein